MIERPLWRDLDQNALDAAWEHQERLSNLIAQAAVGIAQTDLQGRFLLVNDRYCEIVGRDRETLLKQRVPDITHPEDAAESQICIQKLVQTGEPFAIEKRYVRPDGSFVWVSNYVSATRTPSGQPQFLVAVVQDITARKQAEAALRESEDHYRHLVELSPHIPWTADSEGKVLEVSQRSTSLTGLSSEQILGDGWLSMLHPHDRPGALEVWSESLRHGTPLDTEFRVRLADGGYRWMRSRATPRRDALGSIIRWYGTLEDIHDRELAQEALRESEENYRYTVELSPQIPWSADAEGQIMKISPRWGQLVGMTRENALGLGWMAAIHPEDVPRMQASWARSVASDEPLDVDYRVRLADGSYRWFRSRAAARRDENGQIIRWYGTAEDIHERKLAVQQISYMAYHDPLTDLPNRRLFHRELERALAGLGPSEHLALHFVDLDQFKGVNDTLGHAAGDALLRQAADRLRRCVPDGSLLARIGGDEFAVIQTDLRGPGDAAALAQRMIQALDEGYQIDERLAVAGASIGIALVSQEDAVPDEVARNADIALFRAKADRRGTFRFFEPAMDEVVRRKQELRIGLRTALDRGELELHFQPLVEIGTGEVTCLESLLRWRHPDQGMISPTEFIPVAEETGLIMQMGEWALRTACREAARWPDAVHVAVNLSPVQFRNPGLPQVVAGALAASGLAAGRLELEITESVLLQEDQASLTILRELSRQGVRIALDDFGTGFSSLAYLLRFPIDKIKIDQSFVTGLPDRRESEAVIRAVISMSRSLGISVTAEGVETAEQLEALHRLGCDDVQGYLISRPVPAADVMALIDRLRRPD